MKKITFSIAPALTTHVCVCSEEALERNMEIVRQVACNGTYDVEDTSGEFIAVPSAESRLEAVEIAVQNIPKLISAAIKSALEMGG